MLTAADRELLLLAAEGGNICLRVIAPQLDELERTNNVVLLKEILDKLRIYDEPRATLQGAVPHLRFPDTLAPIRARLEAKKKALLG